MSNLRSDLIKLAHDNPGEVQDALLPLLRKASFPKEVGKSLDLARAAHQEWNKAVSSAYQEISFMRGAPGQGEAAMVLRNLVVKGDRNMQGFVKNLERWARDAGNMV